MFNIVKLRLIGWNAFAAVFISIRLNWVLQNSGHSFTGEGRVLYGEVFEIGEAALAGKAI